MSDFTLQQKYDQLLEKYTHLLKLAEKGLEACATCRGSGSMKFGLVTDPDRETFPCDSCGRPILKQFIETIGE